MTCTMPKKWGCVIFAQTAAGKKAAEEYRVKNSCGKPGVAYADVLKTRIIACAKHFRLPDDPAWVRL